MDPASLIMKNSKPCSAEAIVAMYAGRNRRIYASYHNCAVTCVLPTRINLKHFNKIAILICQFFTSHIWPKL